MELDTRDDEHRARLRQHFSSINSAERETASALTLELMANDAQAGQKNKQQ